MTINCVIGGQTYSEGCYCRELGSPLSAIDFSKGMMLRFSKIPFLCNSITRISRGDAALAIVTIDLLYASSKSMEVKGRKIEASVLTKMYCTHIYTVNPHPTWGVRFLENGAFGKTLFSQA